MQDYTALKDLIAICRDAEQGFRGAANAVKTPTLRRIFEMYSTERRDFADELIQAGRSLGLDLENPVGVGGVLHAGWMELRGVLSGHSEHQILVETARGEEMSLKTYRQALNMNLSDETRAILQRQAAAVQKGHDRMLILRDSTARAGGADETRQAY